MFGAALGGLGGLSSLGGLMGGGQDPGKKQWAQMLRQYKLTQNLQNVHFANALAMQNKGLGAIKTGYTNALNSTNQQAGVAKQGVLDRETRNLGSLKSGLADSGMSGGTLGANLERGVYSDTNRSLANVDSQFAALRQQLNTQRAQLEANQYGALSGLFQNQAGQSGQLGMSMFNAIGNQQHPDPNAWLGNLVQGGMNILPFLV